MRRAWLRCDGARLIAAPAGALVWPERLLLVVADLHLEKASALARRGFLLSPYDTRSTLARLEAAVRRWRPRCVISLGDGFHDGAGSVRLAPDDRARLERLIAVHDWLWVVGNHDPMPPQDLGGRVEAAVRIAASPCATCRTAHPAAPRSPATCTHARASSCVAGGCTGAASSATSAGCCCPRSAGGLDVFDPAIAGLFEDGFRAALLGAGGVYALPHHRLSRPGTHGMSERRGFIWSHADPDARPSAPRGRPATRCHRSRTRPTRVQRPLEHARAEIASSPPCRARQG